MELNELTLNDLKEKQIVVVEFAEKHCLTFLVNDCKNPQVPGFPACSLSYYDNLEEARINIRKIYKKLNYKPKNNTGLKSVFRSK